MDTGNTNCPRPGKECNEFMCGNSIDGICQENKIKCDFCNTIYNASELKRQYWADREVCNCITYDEGIDEYCLWNECVDDYYTGNIMEINYCPKCGKKLNNAKF